MVRLGARRRAGVGRRAAPPGARGAERGRRTRRPAGARGRRARRRRLRHQAARRPRRRRREDRAARRRRPGAARAARSRAACRIPERSGLFLYLNTNKRGVTLDLRRAAAAARRSTASSPAPTCSCTTSTRPRWPRTGSTGTRLHARQPAPGDDLDRAVRRRPDRARHWRATDLVLWSAGGIADAERRPGAPGAAAAQGVRPAGRLPGRAERRHRVARRALRARRERHAASTSRSRSRSRSPRSSS